MEIPSDQGISFDKKPEMKAIAIAEKAAEALRSGEWDQVFFSPLTHVTNAIQLSNIIDVVAAVCTGSSEHCKW